MKQNILFFLAVLIFSLVGNLTWAGDNKKSEIKKIKSWNLKDWLEQKERNKMMDMWLVMHTPSPFEFALSYAHIGASKKLDSVESETEYSQVSFMAYASLVGLEIQSEKNNDRAFEDTVGIFHFRLFGSADQTTHLTFNFGQKSRQYKGLTGPSLRRQTFGEADLTIYFNDYFGVQGVYRGYTPITEDPDWGTVTGSQYEAGAFIDYDFIRIFLLYTREAELTKINSLKSDFSSDGYKSGLKIYF